MTDDDAIRVALHNASVALRDEQFMVARALDARGLYMVRPGDSLARIAGFFYGDGNLWSALYDANSHVLPDPNDLQPGMTLVVP